MACAEFFSVVIYRGRIVHHGQKAETTCSQIAQDVIESTPAIGEEIYEDRSSKD
jgi:hypothetical protein